MCKQYEGAVCRGSIQLGSGCGHCEDCLEELIQRSDKLTELQKEIDDQGTKYSRDILIEIVDDVVIDALKSFFDVSEPEEYLPSIHNRLEKEWDIEFPIEKEETIPVTLGTIKAICGWSRYCEVTHDNEYMLNEWTVTDTEIFHVKRSHAITLGLAKE